MTGAVVLPICMGIVSIIFCTVIGFAKGWSGIVWFFIGLAHAVAGFLVSTVFAEVFSEVIAEVFSEVFTEKEIFNFVETLIFWIGIGVSAFGLLVVTLIPCKREKTNLKKQSIQKEEHTLDENN